MALTPSTMPPIGTKAPDFTLADTVSGKRLSQADFAKKKGLLVMFMCNHCPYVKHVQDQLVALGKDYEKKDVAIVGISSNDAKNYPDDSPEELGKVARTLGYRFPVLYDESQAVAKAYGAACTPDFFLYDRNRALYYRGQLDDSRPNSGLPVTGKDLRAAMEALLADQPAPSKQKPSVGCNIKWRS